jgi:hypothetical protein
VSDARLDNLSARDYNAPQTPMKRALIATVVGLLMVGCGKHYWNRPGATFADFSRDSSECAQENALITSGNKAYGMVRPDLYRACMRGRGWARAQHPDPPPGWFRGIESDDIVKLDAPPPQPSAAPVSTVSPSSAPPSSDPTLAVLTGMWTGTLTGPPGTAISVRRVYPATLRIAQEGDQLRWSLAVTGADLGGSGVVVRSEEGTSLTGRLGHSAAPTSFAVTLTGSTLEASGLGADNWVYRLALQRQRR